MRIRTIITQDAEVDDQNSLRHFLFYANEMDVQGIIQTSSKFHWIGVPGAVRPDRQYEDDFGGGNNSDKPAYDKPYRWPGTKWMDKVIDDYEYDYPMLIKQADGYPTPEYLRSVTKVGNIGYEGEMDKSTEGSDLIKERIMDDDDRTLYIQVWGGTNTIARALKDIQEEYQNTEVWDKLHDKITRKVVITACGEQDYTYKEYVAENWPGIMFVKTLQMMSYAYPWFNMPEGDSKDTLRSEFMKREILSKNSALIRGYCTWLDGNRYEGEEESSQFGANPNVINEWFGAKMVKETPVKYDFLSEGDSPTYIVLIPFGMRTLEDFTYGGVAGRYHKVKGYINSKGQQCNVWDVSRDKYTDRYGNVTDEESMWRYVADIQRDFAARVNWADSDSDIKCEHSPKLNIAEGIDIKADSGCEVQMHLSAMDADGLGISYECMIYKEISPEWADDSAITLDENTGTVKIAIDENAVSGEKIHLIVKAISGGYYKLFNYKHVIISIN